MPGTRKKESGSNKPRRRAHENADGKSADGKIDRRNALRKIVKTTTYAVPIATVLLVGTKDGYAGNGS